jgi:hypothetical protein
VQTARFWRRVDVGDCWQWTGYIDKRGYGALRVEGRSTFAHRVAYQLLVGPVPEGLELDHLCRNRACVNPDHLEPVTHAENMRRGMHARKTRCAAGHPFDTENTYIIPASGQRACRICIRQRNLEYKRRQRALQKARAPQ